MTYNDAVADNTGGNPSGNGFFRDLTANGVLSDVANIAGGLINSRNKPSGKPASVNPPAQKTNWAPWLIGGAVVIVLGGIALAIGLFSSRRTP